MYYDKANMDSGNGNGDSLSPIIVPTIAEEVSDVVIPQAPTQLTPPLFKDCRIFVYISQYHWHVASDAISADMEARQCLVALAQQLSEFDQRMEAREAEMLWKLELVAMKDELQAILAGYTNEIKSEIIQMQRQLAVIVEKDVNKMNRDLSVLRVDRDYLQQEVVPGLQQNEARLRTRIEQLE